MVDDDRRREPREPVTLVVDYDGVDDLVGDYTSNLSAGGTFVQTEREMPLGSEVRLVLSFPGLLRPIALEGVVRWVHEGGADERGVGIEFKDYDDRVRDELARVIEALRQRNPDLMRRVVRILIVEDNPHVARFIKEGLTGSSRFPDVVFDLVAASDGRGALARLEAQAFDAAIVDMYLPLMDGSHLIGHIRRDPRLATLPIIAVSAGGAPARSAALDAGADLFLEKPMRLRQIVDSMVSLVGLRDR